MTVSNRLPQRGPGARGPRDTWAGGGRRSARPLGLSSAPSHSAGTSGSHPPWLPSGPPEPAAHSPGFHRRSSSVTMSTPPIRLAQNSSKLSDSGSFPDMPAITTSSMLLPAGRHGQPRPHAELVPLRPGLCPGSSRLPLQGPAGPHSPLGLESSHHSPNAGGPAQHSAGSAHSPGPPAISLLRAGPVSQAAGGETARRCTGWGGGTPPRTEGPPRTRHPEPPSVAPRPNLGGSRGRAGAPRVPRFCPATGRPGEPSLVRCQAGNPEPHTCAGEVPQDCLPTSTRPA